MPPLPLIQEGFSKRGSENVKRGNLGRGIERGSANLERFLLDLRSILVCNVSITDDCVSLFRIDNTFS